MLTHLRRSVVLAIISLVLVRIPLRPRGTGVSQLLFKGQADGSITAERVDPHRTELVGHEVSRASARELCVPGPSRRPGPIRRQPQRGYSRR